LDDLRGCENALSERKRHEQSARVGTMEESDVESWLAIADAAIEWLDQSSRFDEVVH
jgi:hypothetical protein